VTDAVATSRPRCDCYGCWFSGRQGICGCFVCSECDEEGDVILEVEDAEPGWVQQRCAACRGEP
jgi:hypothetical protein